MGSKAFNDLLPCTIHLSFCSDTVDMPRDGGTDMHRTKSWVLSKTGHGGPETLCLGCAMMEIRPVSAREEEMCGPYDMSAITVMPSPVRLSP